MIKYKVYLKDNSTAASLQPSQSINITATHVDLEGDLETGRPYHYDFWVFDEPDDPSNDEKSTIAIFPYEAVHYIISSE